ncbi:MAG: MBL fold metallo-hydrolase [Methylococcales bacterium]|jgi:hydroxyacylglutathione hydrolase|nr:MBL fold metallo-hydrolase [Methylococcales bacterium]MBT7445783.1 MBL fold metallo-hydrolase [Methylococcales bacterium]
MTYQRKTFPVGPLQCNCTIIYNTENKHAIVVDPGGDADKILAFTNALSLTITQILHTHAHFDHFLAAGELKAATGASIALHKSDLFLWDMLEEQCKMFGVPYTPAPGPDQWLCDDQDIFSGQAIHTPGHTPGSMSFWFEAQKLLIAGDTLFKSGIGRTDLWGGDFGLIKKSITQRLFTLDENADVVTGHGPETTILAELQSSPILKL